MLGGGGGGGSAAPVSAGAPVTFGNVTQGGTGVSTKTVVIVGIIAVVVLGAIFLFTRRGK